MTTMTDTNTTNGETITLLNDIFQSTPPPFQQSNGSGGSTTATLVLKSHNILGECILYDDQTNDILWTDIDGREFHKLNLSNGQHTFVKLNKKLGAFGLRPKGERGYLFAWEDGFQLCDIVEDKTSDGGTGTCVALSEMSVGEEVNPQKLPTRLNDGRVDPTGKFFICGGYYGDIDGQYMKVFKCSIEQKNEERQSLCHEPIVDKIQVTNSICWSNDGKTMYLADSPTKTIFQHDYDVTNGTLSNKRVLSVMEQGVPDGSCVDSKGNIWNALWRNGAGPSKVQCIDPLSGNVIYTVHMPDTTSQITCCCFGGPNLDVLFISTAYVNRDREKEPFGGCVYAVKLDMKGCLEKRFIGQ